MEQVDTAFERLGPVDSLFWHLEGRPTHMHLGTLGVFEDTGLSLTEIRDHVAGCLPAIPRWTQKLQGVRFNVGHPVWVDDPTFDVAAPVTEVSLPAPAGHAELYDFVADVNSHPIDPTRPLWRIWVVRMSDNRMALVMQAHHALADGISTWEIVTQLFDLERDAPAKALPPAPPRPAPTDAQLVRRTLGDHVGTLATTVRSLATSSRDDLTNVARSARSAFDYGRRGLSGPPKTSLNEPIGHRRRFLGVRTELDAVKAIKKDNGCTVNDVVVALAAGGLRTLFAERDELYEGMEIRAMVPVSLHGDGAAPTGNDLGCFLVDLPVGEPDPLERLRKISERFDEQKYGNSLEGLRAVTSVMPHLPPPLVRAVGGRLANGAFNVAISNVPGPSFPVYFRGGQMLEPFPVLPLAGRSAVAISVMSYLDRLNFGVLGDHDLVPDLPLVGRGIEDELERLSA